MELCFVRHVSLVMGCMDRSRAIVPFNASGFTDRDVKRLYFDQFEFLSYALYSKVGWCFTPRPARLITTSSASRFGRRPIRSNNMLPQGEERLTNDRAKPFGSAGV